MPIAYLEGELALEFDRWLERTAERHQAELAFSEIRKGVQALSSLWVERREAGRLGGRASEGRGKRAALASYFAPLHFLSVHHALRELGPDAADPTQRIVDLGCGTGATGAALATARLSSQAGARPRILAIDRSGWALGEARRTYAAFGLPHRTRRGSLPDALVRPRPGDLLALGWVVNELERDARDALLARLVEALRRGAGLLVAEPLSTRTSPWWKGWVERLGRERARDIVTRLNVLRPLWIEQLDRAAVLDHRIIGARLIFAPPRS